MAIKPITGADTKSYRAADGTLQEELLEGGNGGGNAPDPDVAQAVKTLAGTALLVKTPDGEAIAVKLGDGEAPIHVLMDDFPWRRFTLAKRGGNRIVEAEKWQLISPQNLNRVELDFAWLGGVETECFLFFGDSPADDPNALDLKGGDPDTWPLASKENYFGKEANAIWVWSKTVGAAFALKEGARPPAGG